VEWYIRKLPLENPHHTQVLYDKGVDGILPEIVRFSKKGIDIGIMKGNIEGAKKPLGLTSFGVFRLEIPNNLVLFPVKVIRLNPEGEFLKPDIDRVGPVFPGIG
jgi:hypothetical protein